MTFKTLGIVLVNLVSLALLPVLLALAPFVLLACFFLAVGFGVVYLVALFIGSLQIFTPPPASRPPSSS